MSITVSELYNLRHFPEFRIFKSSTVVQSPFPHYLTPITPVLLRVNAAITLGRKSFMFVFRCQHLLSGFLVKGHLLRISLQSCDKADNGVIHGFAQIYWIHLTVEQILEKYQLGGHLKAVRPAIASNRVLYFRIRSVEWDSASWSRKEGRESERERG